MWGTWKWVPHFRFGNWFSLFRFICICEKHQMNSLDKHGGGSL